MLKLHNSLTQKKEDFIPVNPAKIGIYTCGLTVYDRPHLGHARSMIVYDILYRTLRELYGEKQVFYVRNITDIDDKINKRATKRGITIQELTDEMIEYFNEDMEYLNNLEPNAEPKATEHVEGMIEIIQKLIKDGHAYVADGHVLFDVNSYKDYGKLSRRSVDEMIAGARVEVAPYKKNPMDFVLWKPSLEIDDESSKFNSPWGVGRPGWHIECSAMSHRYLGETFDIHCGGNDLKFPHHENEIAQSVCAFKGSEFAKFWFHVGFLTVNGTKMGKSLGNFITIEELRNKGIKGSVIRYAFLKNHYTKPFDFSMKLVEEAEKNLRDLHNVIEKDSDTKNTEIPKGIMEALCDDLNTSKAIAELQQLKHQVGHKEIKSKILKKVLEFLGIFNESFFEVNKKDVSKLKISEKEIEKLIHERSSAKKSKEWKKADEIRGELKKQGVNLIDREGSVTDWEIL